MTSPFSRYVNLRLEVLKGTGVFTRDSETGLQKEAETKIIFLASVEDANRQNSTNRMAGMDSQAIYLEGYSIKPKFLPSYITVNSRVKAFLIDPATKQEVEGEFLFDLVKQSRFKAVTRTLGSEIKGWFTSLG